MSEKLAISPRCNLRPAALAHRIRRYCHAPPEETKRILKLAGLLTDEVAEKADEIAANCSICAKSGLPKPSRKASLSHVDEAFNEHLQAYYVFCDIRNTNYVFLHAVDAATGFSEAMISPDRSKSTGAALDSAAWGA